MRGQKKRKRQRLVTVRGVVALAEWSDSRSDAEVMIITDDVGSSVVLNTQWLSAYLYISYFVTPLTEGHYHTRTVPKK